MCLVSERVTDDFLEIERCCFFSVDDENLGRFFELCNPVQEFGLVGMGREAAESMYARPYDNVLSKHLYHLRAVHNLPSESDLGL